VGLLCNTLDFLCGPVAGIRFVPAFSRSDGVVLREVGSNCAARGPDLGSGVGTGFVCPFSPLAWGTTAVGLLCNTLGFSCRSVAGIRFVPAFSRSDGVVVREVGSNCAACGPDLRSGVGKEFVCAFSPLARGAAAVGLLCNTLDFLCRSVAGIRFVPAFSVWR